MQAVAAAAVAAAEAATEAEVPYAASPPRQPAAAAPATPRQAAGGSARGSTDFRSVNIVQGGSIGREGFSLALAKLLPACPQFMMKASFKSLTMRVVTPLPACMRPRVDPLIAAESAAAEARAGGGGGGGGTTTSETLDAAGAVTVSLFKTGSMISTGASSPAEARAAMLRVTALLRDLGVPAVLSNLTVNSAVYSGRTPHAIDIPALSEYMLRVYKVHAVTVKFPAARFRNVPLDPALPKGVTFVVFYNGTVNVPKKLSRTVGTRVLHTISEILRMFPYHNPDANSTAWHRAVTQLRDDSEAVRATPARIGPPPLGRKRRAPLAAAAAAATPAQQRRPRKRARTAAAAAAAAEEP